jgi:hypothetical protein
LKIRSKILQEPGFPFPDTGTAEKAAIPGKIKKPVPVKTGTGMNIF